MQHLFNVISISNQSQIKEEIITALSKIKKLLANNKYYSRKKV